MFSHHHITTEKEIKNPTHNGENDIVGKLFTIIYLFLQIFNFNCSLSVAACHLNVENQFSPKGFESKLDNSYLNYSHIEKSTQSGWHSMNQSAAVAQSND